MTTHRSIIEDELVRLIASIVNVEPAGVQLGAGLADVGINSLQLVEIVFVIEEKYSISIPYNANERRVESVQMLLDLVVDLIETNAEPQTAAAGA